MPSTTRYRRGDIVLVPFPFTDLSSSKRRPSLVVSPDEFNDHMQDLVVVAITSQLTDENAVVIEQSDCVNGVLPKTSVVKLAKVFTIHSRRYPACISSVPKAPPTLRTSACGRALPSERPGPPIGRIAKEVRPRPEMQTSVAELQRKDRRSRGRRFQISVRRRQRLPARDSRSESPNRSCWVRRRFPNRRQHRAECCSRGPMSAYCPHPRH
jgi:mRNA interferase MazF